MDQGHQHQAASGLLLCGPIHREHTASHRQPGPSSASHVNIHVHTEAIPELSHLEEGVTTKPVAPPAAARAEDSLCPGPERSPELAKAF